jgi:hypothetical protein
VAEIQRSEAANQRSGDETYGAACASPFAAVSKVPSTAPYTHRRQSPRNKCQSTSQATTIKNRKNEQARRRHEQRGSRIDKGRKQGGNRSMDTGGTLSSSCSPRTCPETRDQRVQKRCQPSRQFLARHFGFLGNYALYDSSRNARSNGDASWEKKAEGVCACAPMRSSVQRSMRSWMRR